MHQKPFLVWFLVFLGILGLLILGFFLFRKPPLEVPVVRVQRGKVEALVTNTRVATIKCRRSANLSPEIGGKVVALPFQEGDRVEKGSVLLKLDDREAKNRLALAQARLQRVKTQEREAQNNLSLAEKEWQRIDALQKQGLATKDQWDKAFHAYKRAQSALETAKALVKEGEEEVVLMETLLEQTRLRAPFSGILGEVDVEVGEWITPSPPGIPMPSVMTLFDPATLYISAPIDEMDAPYVKPGQLVRITLDAYPDKIFSGKVKKIASLVKVLGEQHRTVEVEISVDFSLTPPPLPGTSADVEIVVGEKQGVLHIPTSAISEGGKVLIVEGGRLKEKEITLGISNWSVTEVAKGLKEGELVVVRRDNPKIKPGIRVQPILD